MESNAIINDFVIRPKCILKSKSKYRKSQIEKAKKFKDYYIDSDLIEQCLIHDGSGRKYNLEKFYNIELVTILEIINEKDKVVDTIKVLDSEKEKISNVFRKQKALEVDLYQFYFDLNPHFFSSFNKFWCEDKLEKLSDLKKYISGKYNLVKFEKSENSKDKLLEIIQKLYFVSCISEFQANTGLLEIENIQEWEDLINSLSEKTKELKEKNDNLTNSPVKDKENILKQKEEIMNYISTIDTFIVNKTKTECFSRYVACKRSAISNVLLFGYRKLLKHERMFNVAASFFELSNLGRNWILKDSDNLLNFLDSFFKYQELDEEARSKLFDESHKYLEKNLLVYASVVSDIKVLFGHENRAGFILPEIDDIYFRMSAILFDLTQETRRSFNMINDALNNLEQKEEDKSEEQNKN